MKITIIIVSMLILFGISHTAKWNYYRNNKTITSSIHIHKLSVDEVQTPKPDYVYYEVYRSIDTISAGFFPFINVKSKNDSSKIIGYKSSTSEEDIYTDINKNN